MLAKEVYFLTKRFPFYLIYFVFFIIIIIIIIDIIFNRLIVLVGRVFVNGLGDWGSIPGRIMPAYLLLVVVIIFQKSPQKQMETKNENQIYGHFFW